MTARRHWKACPNRTCVSSVTSSALCRRDIAFAAGRSPASWAGSPFFISTRKPRFLIQGFACRRTGSSRACSSSIFDQDIWETALKLKAQAGQENSSGYAEALALVLTHELIRLDRPASPFMPVRGGLATWQQKKVSEYVEEHLNADISLNTLAGIAELSPYHFARAFKQSFGAPPHRYVTDRRTVRAKALLENPARTVTEVGIEVGFAETSSFTATFRRMTGMTPTDYRRHLG